MVRITPIPVPHRPPLWEPILADCRAIMRDLGAPAVLIEGRLVATPFGPRLAATIGLPEEMGPVPLPSHPAYRTAMRDAAGFVTFIRMAALAASGIDPVLASREQDDVLWQVIVLPAGTVLIVRNDEADFGPFLLVEEAADERRIALAGMQLRFAGITVG